MGDGFATSEQFDRFEVVEEDTRVRASTPDGESVTLPGGWFGDDADWRDAYRAVLDDCLPDCLSFDGPAATVPRANALAALADAEDLSSTSAEALLAYFDAEGVVNCTEESVAVLFDPDDDRPERDLDLTAERWTTAVDALVAELERFDDELSADDGPGPEDRAEERLEELAEEIRTLTPGEDIPDPDDLDADQRERFRELKQEFVYYKQLRETNVSKLTISLGLAGRTDGLRDLPDGSADPLGAFETVVEATAALELVTENEDIEVVHNRFVHLTEVLDDLGEK